MRGDGAGGYAADPTITGWNAAASTVDTDQAEWQIPIELVTLNLCNKFGIAVYHQGFDVRPPTPADYGWPSGQFFNSPKTWQEAQLGSNPCSGKIAYVYRIDAPTAGNFKTFLESRGFSVQLIPMATVLATNFSGFDLVIIADDTGNLSQWPQGIGGVSPEANHIRSFNRPMMGLGEGGYAYFGKLGQEIGWPNGWHGPLDRVSPRNVGQPYWQTPTSWGVAPPDPFPVYNNPLNEVGIYLPAVSGVIEYGVEPSSTDHAPLIVERAECSQLWGFSGRPAGMTPSGQDLFVNAVVFGIGQQCPEPPQPPADCVTLEKTAIPAHNTPVSVGAVIRYTIKYTVKNDPLCALQRAILEDKVPERTLFIPGSASDGIAPGADDVLRWNVGTAGARRNRRKEVRRPGSRLDLQRPAPGEQSGPHGHFSGRLHQQPGQPPGRLPARGAGGQRAALRRG